MIFLNRSTWNMRFCRLQFCVKFMTHFVFSFFVGALWDNGGLLSFLQLVRLTKRAPVFNAIMEGKSFTACQVIFAYE